MALFGKLRSRRLLTRSVRARWQDDRGEALRLAEAALSLDPASEPAQLLVAELLPQGDDVEAAIIRLHALVRDGAQVAKVPLRLASLLVRAGRAEEALEVLAPALPAAASVPDQLDRLHQRAATLSRLERWPECVEALRELVEHDAAHAILDELATALEHAGRPREALPLRRELARFRADDWYAHLGTLARDQARAAISALGAEPEAVLALPSSGVLVELAPAELEALLQPLPEPWRAAGRAHVARCSARTDDARATLTAAGDHPTVRYERAILDMCEDTITRSVEALDELREEGWCLPGLAYWQAVAHHAAGDDARAAVLYRALLDEDPDHGHAWYLLADVLLRLEGRAAERATERRAYVATPLLLHRVLRSQLDGIAGLAARSRMQRLDPDDPALVTACAEAGAAERARTLLSRWLERDDLDVPTRVTLARAGLAVEAYDAVGRLVEPLVAAEDPEGLTIDGERLVGAGKPILASERLRRATVLDPELGRAWEILGVLLAQRNELAEAEPVIRRAVALVPEIPDVHRNLARLLLDARRGAEAVEPAERAIAMLGSDVGSLRLLARAYEAAGDEPWSRLAEWAAAFHQEQALHRAALGGVWPTGLPGNVQRPPDVFRPSFGRFRQRLEEVARGLQVASPAPRGEA
jgi:tetratricopeptide (TPR) repeat protein